MNINNFQPKSLPAALLNKPRLTVSCLGDSITAGSFNVPGASSIWYPTRANQLLAQNPARTSWSAEQLFNLGEAKLEAGCSRSGEVFTLESNNKHPQVGVYGQTVLPVDDRLYLISAELNSSSSVGAQLAIIVFGVNSNNQVVTDSLQFAGGYDMDSAGYSQVSYVFSPRFIASLDPAIVGIGVGVILAGDGSMKAGKVRNLRLHEIERGIALHNQGVSYTTVAEGLATIDKVIKWRPDVCIVAYGTNDIRNGVSLADYCNDLKGVVDILQTNNIFPVIATLPPLGNDQINFDQVPVWNEFIHQQAKVWEIGLWDRWQAFDNGSLSFIEDGRHPTRAGYQRLGENIASFFV